MIASKNENLSEGPHKETLSCSMRIKIDVALCRAARQATVSEMRGSVIVNCTRANINGSYFLNESCPRDASHVVRRS